MIRCVSTVGAALAIVSAAPATATLPTPDPTTASREAGAYLFNAGAGDVFEIVSGQRALQKSANPAIRNLASELIAHHTGTTNGALAAAAAAGVAPPPPELSPEQKGMIAQLDAVSPTGFDALYLQQQGAAHRQALALHSGYAATGDVPALRTTASTAIPIVRTHIAQIQQLAAQTR